MFSIIEHDNDDIQREFPEGNYICRQGYHGDSFYIIASGSVRVTQEILINNNLESKEEKILRTLKKGDYFGEQALLSGKTINIIHLPEFCFKLMSKDKK